MSCVQSNSVQLLVPKEVCSVKCLKYELIYSLIALWHLVSAQAKAKEHKTNIQKIPCKSIFPGGSLLSIPCHCFWGSGDTNITRESNQNCASVHTSALQGPSQVLGVILRFFLGTGRKGCQTTYGRL